MFKLQNERSTYIIVNPVVACLMGDLSFKFKRIQAQEIDLYMHKYRSTVRVLFIISLNFLLYILHRLF